MISAINFSKKYGNFTAIDSINFKIEKGEIVGFVGKNGAGKSTTIKALLNFIFPSEGKLYINDLNSATSAKEIKKIAAYMSSDAGFYNNITAKELFLFYCNFQNIEYKKATDLFEYFELDENKKFNELSLGNKKKVSIIQCLLSEKEVLILDEPTNGLDPLMQEKFFKLLLEKREKGATVFLSSHNLSEIEKYCDRVLIIKDGKIIDDIDLKKVSIKKTQTVYYKTKDGLEKTFDYNDDINELIKSLSLLNLQTLEIKNKNVTDDFIKYYKEEE